MVGSLPPIRHVIAVTAKTATRQVVLLASMTKPFRIFLERGRHLVRSRNRCFRTGFALAILA